ncbi:hypothetical protein M434DRAFT_150570 [Hypoxylon sp. CO27-5]|nr:hypothetical protein M434DRAFT_150570 [Hypoxylon sp. CO27-5]
MRLLLSCECLWIQAINSLQLSHRKFRSRVKSSQRHVKGPTVHDQSSLFCARENFSESTGTPFMCQNCSTMVQTSVRIQMSLTTFATDDI